MLLAAEGSLSMPTEFNEWGDFGSMSMDNYEDVNLYKYADANGETEVVETVSTGLRGGAGN
jgi:hypothetical protein